ACVSVAPGKISGARTPSRPRAAITVVEPHEEGTEPSARSPPPCPGVGRRHRRVDPRLVDENQPFCLDSPHLRPVSPPLGLHLGSVPLAGMQGLLLVGQAEAAEGAPE